MTDKRLHGIEMWTDAAGRQRYRVRIRRAGRDYGARFDRLSDAIAWRDQAIAASRGLAEPPGFPAPAALEPLGRAVTVEDASRRLARGMKDGSLRSCHGTPYKPSVVRKYEEALRTLVVPEIGAVPITTLTTGDVQRLVDGIAASKTPEHGRKALTALRVALA